MRTFYRAGTCLACASLMFSAAGCKSNSQTRVRSYDYSDEPHGRAQNPPPVETEREVGAGEYEMVAPGEMVSPGKPVVDPK